MSREWEVKARLEIDRQVEMEYQARLGTLQAQFDEEVSRKVKEQMSRHICSAASNLPNDTSNHQSSTITAEESEWTNSTDLTDLSELSIHSPSTSISSKPLPKKTKTPFTRSKTTFDSPADICMAEPSPMSITSLNLSPRRQAVNANPLIGKHLFNKIATNKARLTITDDLDEDKENELSGSDDEDCIPDLPSPTRPKMHNTDPFKLPLPTNPLPSKARPNLQRQHTIATTNKLVTKPNLFPTAGNSSSTAAQLRAGFAGAQQAQQPSQIPRSATESDFLRKVSSPTQPKRQLTKIPSRGDLALESALHATAAGSTSPLRRAATTTAATSAITKLQTKLGGGRGGLSDGTQQVNMVAGRTRVELAQARAGGRPMSADCEPNYAGIRVVEKELPPVPVWDPEVLGEDAMPSPFLKRDYRIITGLR